MWIFDLMASMASVMVLTTFAAIATRKYYKYKHPEPTLQEQIEQLEALNEELKQQEVN